LFAATCNNVTIIIENWEISLLLVLATKILVNVTNNPVNYMKVWLHSLTWCGR